MLEMTKEKLEEYGALTPALNSITEMVVRAIPFTTVHERMKATVAISQIAHFAAQFQRNIVLPDDTIVPINSIAFVIKGSGYGGDSSVNAAKKCFKPGFEAIENERRNIVKKEAIQAAIDAGEESPTEYAVYKPYMKPIPPIDVAITTEPGLIQHLNDIGELPISTPQLYSGEFSDELAYNPDMVSNIKVLSEMYDLGLKEAKYTKGPEFRSKSINGQSVSALFVGSPGHVLYDEQTKKKFHVAFMSKLARRSWFCYVPERIPEPTFNSIDEMLEYNKSIKSKSKEARASMIDVVKNITAFGIKTAGKNIKLSEEVTELFEVYQRYNSELVESSYNPESTSALIRRHLQWKALKLAGAFAIMDMSDTIEIRHYVEAIQFSELLDKDMEQFEYDLNKAPHERFSDYIRTQVGPDGKAFISVHDIKKQGFSSNININKLKELVHLCVGYDRSGIYTVANEGAGIHYESVIKTDVLGVSFKPINNEKLMAAVQSGNKDAIASAKQAIAATVAYGLDYDTFTFEELADMLADDFAYSPFKFRDGQRNKANLIGGTKWLVLDVDDSPINMEEVHFMLSDINHHIAQTSDPNNFNKFRVLIELDAFVELEATAWRNFFLSIANDLALKVDPLPQSQIFYSYANRTVLSVTDAEPLEVRNYVMEAIEQSNNKTTPSSLTKGQKSAQLSDPQTTFAYAYEAANGEGSRSMYKAIYHAFDLGASLDQVLELLNDINEWWIAPMEINRFNILLEQAERIYNEKYC